MISCLRSLFQRHGGALENKSQFICTVHVQSVYNVAYYERPTSDVSRSYAHCTTNYMYVTNLLVVHDNKPQLNTCNFPFCLNTSQLQKKSATYEKKH